ncbi:hypothetical protein [Escherichia phage KW1E_UTAR]|nr:hypothetical protein [Escherichia phage KW1E_UTAR]
MLQSRTVTARNAGELIRTIYDSLVISHDVIVSTNAPAVSAVIVDSIACYAPLGFSVTRNDKFSLNAVANFLATSLEQKGPTAKFVTIAPKHIQIGTKLPVSVTRIIVDDAAVFLGEVMALIENMKEDSK